MIFPVTVAASTYFFVMFKIGKVSEIVGYSVESIRHYETIGLLKRSERSSSGQRLFDQNDIICLQFIKAFRKIGVSLKDITIIVKAFNEDSFCFKINEMEKKYTQLIEQKRKELDECDAALLKIKKTCQNCVDKADFKKTTCKIINPE